MDNGRLEVRGGRRRATYLLPRKLRQAEPDETEIRLTARGNWLLHYFDSPQRARDPVGHNRDFVDSYRPNASTYLDHRTRTQLRQAGRIRAESAPVGTYARSLLQRLLVDLSWNSSRLEGNTYTLLDTQRLIELGEAAEGRDALETQMILNHKEAIGFLVDGAGEIGFNRYTICNLHAILSSNLLPDERASGRLRRIPVGITGSVFRPLEVPQLVEECFDQILDKASAIRDPFEQSLFLMIHLPYLQPFDDVNKRVSRLAANISFMNASLSPVSFVDVPRSVYTRSLLAVYELNDTTLLRDVFCWAYHRSAARYASVRQTLGEPDPFRVQHQDGLRQVVGEIIRMRIGRAQAGKHIERWTRKRIEAASRVRFLQAAENSLAALNRNNFARFRVTPTEFDAWWQVWTKG